MRDFADMLSTKSSIYKEIKKVSVFFGVSLFCGLVDALIGFLCINVLNVNMFISIVAGYLSGLVLGYLLHINVTFKEEYDINKKYFLNFVLANIVLIFSRLLVAKLLQVASYNFLLDNKQLKETIIYTAVLGISFFINYFMSRMWIFKKKDYRL